MAWPNVILPTTFGPLAGPVRLNQLDGNFTALRTPLLTLYGEHINVKDPTFAGGAKGDGLTDDSAAFTAAIAALPAAGGLVVVPPGQYPIRNVAYRGGLRLVGMNWGSVGGLGASRLINISESGEPTLYNTGNAGSGVQGIEIEYLTFAVGAAATTGHLIEGLDLLGAEISHCHFGYPSAGKACIHLDGCRNCAIEKNSGYGNDADTNRMWAYLTDANGWGCAHNHFRDNAPITSYQTACRLNKAPNNLWEGNGIYGAPTVYGWYLENGSDENTWRDNRAELVFNDFGASAAIIRIEDSSFCEVQPNHWSATGMGVSLVVNAGTSKFNRIIRGTYATNSNPVRVGAGVEDTLIYCILKTYVAAGSDVSDSGIRTIQVKTDTGYGSSFTGTGAYEIQSGAKGIRMLGNRSAAVELATGASADLAALLGTSLTYLVGMLTVTERTLNTAAIFQLKGSAGALAKVSDPDSAWAATDSPGSNCVYYSGGAYHIKNYTGGANRTYYLSLSGA